MRPENGALWVAEAALNFVRGREEPALAALRVAAERPDWDSGGAAAFVYAVDLLEDQGLPRFDAVVDAYSRRGLTPPSRIQVYTRNQLFRMMANAVTGRDEARFAALARQLFLLHAGTWDSPPLPNAFRALPSLDDYSGLVAAMSQRLGIRLPSDESATYADRQGCRRHLLEEYLCLHLGDPFAALLLERDAEFHRQVGRGFWIRPPCFWPALSSSAGGMAALLLLSVIVSGLLLELPFRMQTKPFIRAEATLRLRGWALGGTLVLVSAFMVLVLFRAADSVWQPVGLQSGPSHDLLTPSQKNLVGAIILGVAWTVGRLLIHGRQTLSKVYAGLLWLLSLGYVAAIAVATYYRQETIRLIFEDVLGACPA